MPKNQYTFSGHYYVDIYAHNYWEAEVSFLEFIGTLPKDLGFDEDFEVYSPDDPALRRGDYEGDDHE